MMLGTMAKRLWIREFLQDQRGSATIEFVLWIPGFALLLIVTADASVLYLTHTEMWNVARDTARRVAIGDITDTQATTVAAASLPSKNTYTVTHSNASEADVFVQISVNIGDAAVFGRYFSGILNRPMTARVTMRREPT